MDYNVKQGQNCPTFCSHPPTRQLRKTAHTAHQLRTALAVLMPLEDGLSLEQTAATLGVSKSATSMMRRRFFAKQLQPKRNRAIATLEQENQILDQLLSQAAVGGVVIVPPLLPKIQEPLGKPICLATLYNMLGSALAGLSIAADFGLTSALWVGIAMAILALLSLVSELWLRPKNLKQ